MEGLYWNWANSKPGKQNLSTRGKNKDWTNILCFTVVRSSDVFTSTFIVSMNITKMTSIVSMYITEMNSS